MLYPGTTLKVIRVLEETRCDTAIEVEFMQQEDECSEEEEDCNNYYKKNKTFFSRSF